MVEGEEENTREQRCRRRGREHRRTERVVLGPVWVWREENEEDMEESCKVELYISAH